MSAHELKRWGTNTEQGETFTVYADTTTGEFFAIDPDFPRLLCPCFDASGLSAMTEEQRDEHLWQEPFCDAHGEFLPCFECRVRDDHNARLDAGE